MLWMSSRTLASAALLTLSTVALAAAPAFAASADERTESPVPTPVSFAASGAAAERTGARTGSLLDRFKPPQVRPIAVVTKVAEVADLAEVAERSEVDDIPAPLAEVPGHPTLQAAVVSRIVEPVETDLVYVGADGEPIDVERLEVWLTDRGSPLAPYAEDLVQAGVDHDVDPRLVVGIAAIESTVGLRLPPGSHNAWGWGGDGAHGLAAWPSWPVAIDTFTERLGALYDTESVDEHMAQRYCPPNSQAWLRTVRWVIQDI